MADLSTKDAALAGFRLARAKPGVLLIWTLFRLVGDLLLMAVIVGWAGTALKRLMELEPQVKAAQGRPGPPDMELMQETMRLSFTVALPVAALQIVVTLLLVTVLSTAVYRAVLKPEDKAFGYLRFGRDELRQFAVTLVIALLTALIVGGGIAAVLLLSAAIIGPSGNGGAIFNLVGCGLVVVGALLFTIRLSLAGPQTMATGQVNIFGSWSLAGVRFWRIVWINLLALTQTAVVGGLCLAVIFGAGAAMGIPTGDIMKAMRQPDVTSFASYFSPIIILWTLVGPIGITLATTAMLAPAVPIYLQRQAEESMDDIDD